MLIHNPHVSQSLWLKYVHICSNTYKTLMTGHRFVWLTSTRWFGSGVSDIFFTLESRMQQQNSALFPECIASSLCCGGVCGLLAVAGGLWPAVCGLFADKHGSGDCLPLSLTGCWKPWGQGNRCFDRSRASWPHPAGGGDLRLFASANAGHNICVTRHPPRF